jgi:amidohydrolase
MPHFPPELAGLIPRLVEWRRDLHAHPEASVAEHRTADFIAARLQEAGVSVTRGIGSTGLVGTIRQGDGPAIAIRADMDALEMAEDNDFPHHSRHPGLMHGCGHDGHVMMALGAALVLAQTRKFKGTVHFVFQPAEEKGGGADAMIRDGLLARFPVQAIYGAHNDPSLPVGEMAVVAGAISAAQDDIHICIQGKGGHAARPHLGVDPILVGAEIVMAAQGIVARQIDAQHPTVLSITRFQGGFTCNVIPDRVELAGTLRSLDPAVRAQAHEALARLVHGVAAAHGAVAELEIRRGYPPVINAAAPTRRAAKAAIALLGDGAVHQRRVPSLGAEDFAYYGEHVPACFVRIGQGDADHTAGLHHPRYDFNDAALPVGAAFWIRLVEQELARA